MFDTYPITKKREKNLIWTAADTYEMQPLFLAKDIDGKADFYMDIIIGLAYKYIGETKLEELFRSWEHDERALLFDNIAWLSLENTLFEREKENRNSLGKLRLSKAKDFLDSLESLAGRAWRATNLNLCKIVASRWQYVLANSNKDSKNKKENIIEKQTRLGKDLTSDEIVAAIKVIIREHYKITFDNKKQSAYRMSLKKDLIRIMPNFLSSWVVIADRNLIYREPNHDDGNNEREEKSKKERLSKKIISRIADKDKNENYLRATFGESIYNPDELEDIEKRLCIGGHFGCHLWITKGHKIKKTKESEILENYINTDIYKHNKAAFEANIEVYNRAIFDISEHIRNSLEIYYDPEEKSSTRGILNTPKVWQIKTGNEKLFIQREEQDESDFSVDILLDSSSSRERDQGVIAAQAYVIAEAMNKNNINVRVTSFCSIKGYTILNILRDYQDNDKTHQIWRYMSSGWNRDGLAFRAMGELMHRGNASKKLLIVLTDANPNDDTKWLMEKSLFGKEYSGKVAVEDTLREVNALRREGICVAAVFLGNNYSALDAKKIYEEDMIRIKDLDRFAIATGELISRQIERLYNT